MMVELDALQAVDFDWTRHLDSVWRDDLHDVPHLNAPLRNEITRDLNQLMHNRSTLSPLGRVIVGPAGSGKTHLLGALRKKISKHRIGFILADMTDVHDFWENMLSGYLNSLQQPYLRGKYQYRILLERLASYILDSKGGASTVGTQSKQGRKGHRQFVNKLVKLLGLKHLAGTRNHQDILRALILLNSEDFAISEIGHSWLQGTGIEESERTYFHFRTTRKKPIDIIKGLSWLMSLTGPTVLALDQLDSFVNQYHLASGLEAQDNANEEQRIAYSIIQGIAGGIMALRDITSRTMILVSCLETTWDILSQKALRSSVDRYKEPFHLDRISSAKMAERIVIQRLDEAYQKKDFKPPYPSWPFKNECFKSARGWIPRRVLQYCDNFRNHCLKKKNIVELESFGPILDSEAAENPGTYQRHNEFIEIQKKKIDIGDLLKEENENQLGELLQNACRYLVEENPTSLDIDVLLDLVPINENKSPALHVRIRMVHRNEGDREDHYCIRVIQMNHANAFRPRLKAAITESGIDRNLSFRRLNIVRRNKLPSGETTQKLSEKFIAEGGSFISPSENDLGVIWAIRQFELKNDPDFKPWLKSRRPVSELSLMKNALDMFDFLNPGEGEKNPTDSGISDIEIPVIKISNRPEKEQPAAVIASGSKKIPLGYLLSGAKKNDPVSIPMTHLSKHVAVLAGSGSGKTVLIRRLIEESALLGIPSIVIDGAGDLSRLGDSWPANPDLWDEKDLNKAKHYHKQTEVNIWTPGAEKGNPFYLESIPDFSPIRDNVDELEQAIMMTRESLREIVAPGVSTAAKNKTGVLSAALHFFAQQEQLAGLKDFIDLLFDLPLEAGGGITKADKLAREMSDSLKAQIQVDALLKQKSPLLNPSNLFGMNKSSKKTTISVINFTALPSLESQRQFLNHLSMTLFSWIKKNPSELRGLLVIDEAKDFVPSGKSTPCKESLLRLVSQARKYGLGLIFATQSPKSIDHNIIMNCSTQFYGRVNSPAAIQVIQEQIKKQGGSGLDIPKLKPGQFYTYSEGMVSPMKVAVPLCLSYHPSAPLTETEILERAVKSKCRN